MTGANLYQLTGSPLRPIKARVSFEDEPHQTLHLIFHHFSQFNCCLSVVLQPDEGDHPQNSHVVFCPNKQHYFEPFMFRLDYINDKCTLHQCTGSRPLRPGKARVCFEDEPHQT